MQPHIRNSESSGCAGASGAHMRTLTRYILERVRIKKYLTLIGLLVVMIGGAVTNALP